MSNLSMIEHNVVLMFENRSFDNVLGALYPSSPTFNGVGNAKLPNIWKGDNYWPTHGTDMIQPNPDPHEEYQYVYRQMYDDFTVHPDGPPVDPPNPPNMQGFVADYATVQGSTPPAIMNYYQPADVPVISGLAANYAVCDQWYASAPTQTFCNRSFVHAGTSSGYVNNEWDFGMLINDTTTIQNMLSEAGVKWRLYYDSPTKFLCTAFVAQEKNTAYAIDPFELRIRHLGDFYDDIQSEATFPSYVFIEPNFINNPWTGAENDEHPHAGVIGIGAPSNVLYGEQLLFDVFTALTKSPAWKSTLLIVLYDEHGGTYDHQPPQGTAVSPDGVVIPYGQPGGFGFQFNRFGVRVPAVLVSPWINAGTILNTQFDHTSVLATVLNRFIPGATLLRREAVATDVSSALNATCARTDIPKITPRKPPSFDATAIPNLPLTDIQQHMLILGAKRAAEQVTGAAALARIFEKRPQTHEHAHEIIANLRDAEGLI